MASHPSPSGSWGRQGEVEEALVKAARTLTSHLDVEGACAAVLDAVEDVFGATSIWILLYDAGNRQLRTVCSRGRGSAVFGNVAIPPDVGILGLAFTSRQVVFVANVNEDNRWFDAPRVLKACLQSVFMVPLMFGGNALGVVGLDSPDFDGSLWPRRPRSPSRTHASTATAKRIADGYGRCYRSNTVCAATSLTSRKRSRRPVHSRRFSATAPR